ncbi:hypothetical protein [Vibrio ruber]|uniref:hypothetical protein n=1 Tax=Vibrio ruber TaxID=184755 RepID=UPI00135656D7|nr:hypothetical protein [Vibrio ruber]
MFGGLQNIVGDHIENVKEHFDAVDGIGDDGFDTLDGYRPDLTGEFVITTQQAVFVFFPPIAAVQVALPAAISRSTFKSPERAT